MALEGPALFCKIIKIVEMILSMTELRELSKYPNFKVTVSQGAWGLGGSSVS